jgi:hypothetical protein
LAVVVFLVVQKRDVEELGEVLGVVVGNTVNGVLGEEFIKEFIEIGTVLGDLGE